MTLLDTYEVEKKNVVERSTSGANIYIILGHESSQDQIMVAQS